MATMVFIIKSTGNGFLPDGHYNHIAKASMGLAERSNNDITYYDMCKQLKFCSRSNPANQTFLVSVQLQHSRYQNTGNCIY